MQRFFCAALLCAIPTVAWAHERVKPASSKGGVTYGEPWKNIPESFRKSVPPEWPLPTDLAKWQSTDREKVRATLLECLGEMPARPDPAAVKVLSREEHESFTLERFEFFNGVDMTVPGILAIPKNRAGRVPVIVGMHGHSGSKNEYVPNPENPRSLGWMLVQKGFAVAAIDGYFNGERVGKGPRGTVERDPAAGQELSLFKLHLWQGRTLWGMMLRDEQCLIDYLETRPELDCARLGGTGMSMGCTRSWWLAAIDERVKAIVGIACFTRYTELMAHAKGHGIYYYVPGLLKHFDTEAILALVAPRPMLQLSGDQDHNAPPDGVVVLEQKLDHVYGLYGKPANFRSVLYLNTGHEYLPEMRDEMTTWFVKHLSSP
jgi:dienelactone hydrolase